MLVARAFQDDAGALEIGGGDGERHVRRRRVVGHDLDDHVDIDVGIRERHEDRRGDAGLSATLRRVIWASSLE